MTFDETPDWVDDWATDRDDRADIVAEALDDGEETGWQVLDDDGANWALRKIAKAERELRRLAAVAAHEKDGIDAWLTEASTGPRRTVEFFTGRLIDYRRRLEDDNADLPLTYKLPAGDLTRRAGRASATVTDPDVFCAWALVNQPDAVRMSPLTTPITKGDRYSVADTGAVVETATGEIVPGFVVRTSPPSYGVKVR